MKLNFIPPEALILYAYLQIYDEKISSLLPIVNISRFHGFTIKAPSCLIINLTTLKNNTSYFIFLL